VHGSKRGRAVPVAVMVLVLTMPATTGPSDPARPAAPPTAGHQLRIHFLASPFGTIHAATFDFSPPVGTQIPLADLHLAAYRADNDDALAGDREEDSQGEIQTIDRRLKGPRLVPRVRPDFSMPQPAAMNGKNNEKSDNEKNDNEKSDDNNGEDDRHESRNDVGADLTVPPADPPAATTGLNGAPMRERMNAANAGLVPDDADVTHPVAGRETADQDRATTLMERIYFATAGPGLTAVPSDPWRGAATGKPPQDGEVRPPAPDVPPLNETIASNGEAADVGHRPKSPAELLGLTDAARGRHEKCLANAIYFEARGETVRGQMAVAQVVINRVFSGHYPDNVCGVVYQSTRRYHRLRCQFSFTCNGVSHRITEPDAFERATQIARAALDGHFWLNDIGKATHYHARWVHPRWVREMRRLDRIGVHTFYRPRKWGDGARAPVWGDAEATAQAAKAL
jgi:spore germination cell wall hydrolase CwlJ-like protein